MSKIIRQQVLLPAPPGRVYSALIEQKQHARFTTQPAKISARPGGAFTCYDGYITGFTLDLVPGRRIVQAWRSQGWPKGYYSVVTFALAPAAGGRTRLSFTHDGVPASDFKAKSAGWRIHYWERLKTYLETAAPHP